MSVAAAAVALSDGGRKTFDGLMLKLFITRAERFRFRTQTDNDILYINAIRQIALATRLYFSPNYFAC